MCTVIYFKIMFGKSIFLRNEAFERENFSLALKIVRRRRAIFFAVGALRGVPARRGSEQRSASEGKAFPLKNLVGLLTNWIFEFIFSAQVCSLWHF